MVWPPRIEIATSLTGQDALRSTGLNTSLGMSAPLSMTLTLIALRSRFDNGYITWINEVQSWTMFSSLLEPDPRVELTAARPIPLEPMVRFFSQQ